MLKNLEILDKLVKLATRDFGPSVEELEKKGISINQIKQALEKYSNVMYLLKDLFKLLYVGYEFDEYWQNDYYFIREYGPSSSYLITEDLYLVLKQLEKLVGDDHE